MPFDYSNAAKMYKEFGSRPSSSTPPPSSPSPASGGGQSASTSTPKTTAGKAVKGVFSFLGDVARSTVTPVLSSFVQMPRAFVSGVAGLAGREDIRAEYSKPITLPGIGEVKGLSATPGDVEKYGTATAGEMAGQALEMGASMVGVKGAASVAKEAGKTSLKTLAKESAKQGFIAGSSGSAGAAMQDPENTAADVVGAGLTGGAIGAGLGLAIPVVASAGKNIWRSMMTSNAPKSALDKSFSAINGSVADDVAGAGDDLAKLSDDAAKIGGKPPVAPGMAPAGTPDAPMPMMSKPGVPAMPGATPASTSGVIARSKSAMPLDETIKKEAANAGFDPRVIDLVEGGSLGDRQKMQKQLLQAEKASKSWKEQVRPVHVAGESVLDRLNFVANARKEVGAQYGEAVKNLPKTAVDITPAKQSFISKLLDDGVEIEQKDIGDNISEALKDGTAFSANAAEKMADKPKVKLNFSNTRYANDKASQKLISQLYGELSSSDTLPPQKIVTMRQRLFDDMDMGTKQQALNSRTESILSSVHDDLDKPLQALSSEYAEYSAKYGKIMSALRDVYKMMGKPFKGADEKIQNLRAGEVGMRIGGNASAEPIRVLDQLENVAVQLGYQPTDDVARQFFFADVLDDLYNITQPRSLQGGIERGTKKGMEKTVENIGIMKDAATGSPLSAVSKIYARMQGRTPEEQQQLLRKLLGMPFQEKDAITKIMGN